jgi:hypothetical protein
VRIACRQRKFARKRLNETRQQAIGSIARDSFN